MKDLRRDMAAWTDDRLRDFERGFQSQDHNIARAYLQEVAQEWQRRGIQLDLTKNSTSCYNDES